MPESHWRVAIFCCCSVGAEVLGFLSCAGCVVSCVESAVLMIFTSPLASVCAVLCDASGGAITAETLVAHIEQTIGFGKAAWPAPVQRVPVLLLVRPELAETARVRRLRP